MVVQLVVLVVVSTLTLLNITVQVWGVDVFITGDEGLGDIVHLTSLPADGWDVTDGLVDLWGKVLLLDEFLEELLTEEDITLNSVVLTDWEVLVNDFLVDWDNFFLDLNVNEGLLDEMTLSGDWLNNDLLFWENLNFGLDFSHWLNDGLTLEQSSLELLKEELVVDSLVVGWVVLLSVDGWAPVCGVSVVHILLSVNVWQDIPVPDDEVLDVVLTSISIDILSVGELILTTVCGGWESVLVLEKLNNGVDVLVEEDGVVEVLLEGGNLPEALEVDGGNVPLEDWVLDVLAEEGDGQVLTEELSVVDLFEGEDLVNIVDSLEDILLDDVPLYWQNAFKISDNRLLEGETLNLTFTQLLLQQQIVNDWTLVQQGSLPD